MITILRFCAERHKMVTAAVAMRHAHDIGKRLPSLLNINEGKRALHAKYRYIPMICYLVASPMPPTPSQHLMRIAHSNTNT